MSFATDTVEPMAAFAFDIRGTSGDVAYGKGSVEVSSDEPEELR